MNINNNNNKNEILIKLIFPPTSSIISKTMYIQENQKASDIILYASQLAGLQIGYGLYLPISNNNKENVNNGQARGTWIEDDVKISTIPNIAHVEFIQIKKRPISKQSRKNTMALLKGFKEGKVQKLSSYTKMWNPRYLKLFAQRLIHSPNENDSNTEFISFADIHNIDRDNQRKYTFIVQTTANNNLPPKDHIFRCTNQSECDDWISQIRSLLRKARPDLLLPPLSMNPIPSSSQTNNNNNNNNTSSNSSRPQLSPFKPPLPIGYQQTPPSPTNLTKDSSHNSNNASSSNNSTASNSLNNSINSNNSSSSVEVPDSNVNLERSRSRSFSFSLTSKKKTPVIPTQPLTLTERNSQLEDELKKLKDQMDQDNKTKYQLEKKYKKLKVKYATYKKARSRSISTPSTPDFQRKETKFNPFIIGGNRLTQSQQQQQQQQNNDNHHNNSLRSSINKSNLNNNNSNNVGGDESSINTTTNTSNNGSLHQSIVNNQYHLNQRNSLSIKDDESTVTDDFNTETFSMDTEISDNAAEVKELKDQLTKIKEKLNSEINDKFQLDLSKKSVEKELIIQKRMEEKRLRDYFKRQDDNLDGMSEMASLLKKSLFELKAKIEKEMADEQSGIEDPMESSYSNESEYYYNDEVDQDDQGHHEDDDEYDEDDLNTIKLIENMSIDV